MIRATRRLQAALSTIAILSLLLFGVATRVNAAPAKSSAHQHSGKSSIPQRCKKNRAAKGIFTYSDNQFPDNLNPYQTTLVVSYETLDLTQEGPLNYNNKAKLFADMVTAVPSVKNGGIKDNGKTYIWHLKKGIRWSNGKQITSADWKFGWKVESDPASGPACAGTCDVISRIDTPDTYTVVMHLKHVDASFLTGGHYSVIIPTSWSGGWSKNAHDAANKLFQDTTYNFEGSDYPTNGPYKVDSYTTNDRIVLSPMKYYNILTCGAGLSKAIFAFYSDPTSEIAAASTKAVDLSQGYTFANLTALKSHKSYTTEVSPGFQISHIEMNMDATYNGQPNPLHNTKVREALSLALNKPLAMQSAFSIPKKTAQALEAYNFMISTKTLRAPFVDKKLTGAYDPLTKKYVESGTAKAIADARTLLKQAGYPNCFSIDFVGGNTSTSVSQLSAISKQFEDLGCKMNQLPTPSAKFFGQYNEGGVLATGKFQMANFTWQVTPDPDTLKGFFEKRYIDRAQATHTPNNQNFSGVTDPAFERDFTKADQTVNNKLRFKYYDDAQKRFLREAPWICFYYRPVIATFDGKIKPFQMNPTSAGIAWNAAQWALASAS
jgi:peptide/nickel transport system substrate-binding protein